jgi:RecG-like helicase
MNTQTIDTATATTEAATALTDLPNHSPITVDGTMTTCEVHPVAGGTDSAAIFTVTLADGETTLAAAAAHRAWDLKAAAPAGTPVVVTGTLSHVTSTTVDGEQRTTLLLMANEVEFPQGSASGLI